MTMVVVDEGTSREAVMLALPPFSPMEDGLRWRVTVGVSSSSAMVRVRLGGSLTPRPPLALADTVTVLFGASTPLSTAAMVTSPAPKVWPGAMVRVLLDETAKSSSEAGGTGDAETVKVTALG